MSQWTYFAQTTWLRRAGVGSLGWLTPKSGELAVKYYNDLIYLFNKNMEDNGKPQVFLGHRNRDTITGVSFLGPNDDYVMSGSMCGHVFIWKKKEAKVILVIKDTSVQIGPHTNLPIINCNLSWE
ncbi:putative transcription factor WD40-like family [Rosa chinensis]|uniref:Putative transcription factor WD40-like family n=1 Tax=Rosa chinensis TaxID=74649 RepID=A0A2P6Q423_ROSCH|nr:putative transcription factor WD40-like family [Rosa chinensis]